LKKPVSKADLRAQLEREVEDYLSQGGRVDEVARGISGNEPGQPPVFLTTRLFTEPRESRTLVPEVVAAIEERRKHLLKRTPVKKRARLPKPRKKVIYDDFGEPLRHVWVDE
jgi:hypothetical protein